MKILALDTATQNCTCSLHENNKCLKELNNKEKFSHNKVLFKQIDTLLKKQKWTISDLSGIVIGLGPGSFTGLRVGVSAVKGLALVHNIPIYTLSTLDIMALSIININNKALNKEATVRVLLDGKQKDFFTALYEIGFKDEQLSFKCLEKINLNSLSELCNIKPATFNITDFTKENIQDFGPKHPFSHLAYNVSPQAFNAGLLYYFGYAKKANITTLEPNYYKDFLINNNKQKSKYVSI